MEKSEYPEEDEPEEMDEAMRAFLQGVADGGDVPLAKSEDVVPEKVSPVRREEESEESDDDDAGCVVG